MELDPGMADERLDQEMVILFDECLKKLGKDRAELILMNAIQGMTTVVISKILKTSQNTILTWLTKAKFELKDCINFG
jgi:DNA-directed RNA polymerase specialized sigma24 family protein